MYSMFKHCPVREIMYNSHINNLSAQFWSVSWYTVIDIDIDIMTLRLIRHSRSDMKTNHYRSGLEIINVNKYTVPCESHSWPGRVQRKQLVGPIQISTPVLLGLYDEPNINLMVWWIMMSTRIFWRSYLYACNVKSSLIILYGYLVRMMVLCLFELFGWAHVVITCGC